MFVNDTAILLFDATEAAAHTNTGGAKILFGNLKPDLFRQMDQFLIEFSGFQRRAPYTVALGNRLGYTSFPLENKADYGYFVSDSN